jgi:hypothetical protein
LIAYAAGTVFLGLSYWDIFYHLVFISILLKKFAQEEIAERGLLKQMQPSLYPANTTSPPESAT